MKKDVEENKNNNLIILFYGLYQDLKFNKNRLEKNQFIKRQRL